MMSKVLSSIDGISIYPVIGLIICMLVFIAGVSFAWRKNKSYIQHMSNLPLEKD
ncbi:MAG: CcoQ/FixQ family Cbb3-type cytochrome c oxidase assembly chaperone [Ignavibacteriales bacterium]|nr:hypothetical protein [Ignavibacteriaceae bacterium]MCK6613162.1 cbb3-type cytochrome c oxidase subunit 3 [Ignavibacteriaceae bacterium]QOJ28975.1 MAG: CcoQ/FixQ family Cbb3-type cytochrome c oxidase assembly chaperone [Ignavibacteriales bacterium]